LEEAVSPPELEEAFRCGYWQHFIHPIDCVLADWRAVIVSDERVQEIRNGNAVFLENGNGDSSITAGPSLEGRCRVYTPDGCLLGVLRFNSESGQWHPEKVFL
jgi:tRNA U55 pseudouridine synthase TruB